MLAFAPLEAALDETLLVDRARLRRKLREIRDAQRAGKPFDQNLARWQTELERSQVERQRRLSALPAVTYDETLPIHERRGDIAEAITKHAVVVVSGETGSGKSTQLPKICLELGRGVDGMIGHTQPRRIAARTIAGRLAEELAVPLGREVGYQVRFADVTSPQTYIKLMTDGLLLAESQTDRWLNRYDTLIIDEAHERSLNIDFLLGYLHRLLLKRRDLKLIITSATIDAARFAAHFAEAVGEVPILEVSGRLYPVETIYRPLLPDERGEEPDPGQALADAIYEVCERGPGDVLIFLPTERDIHEAMKCLRGRSFPGGAPELLPLYARLSVADQQRVFQPSGHRRLVLATNVAESSLTVPGIRYVVDTGTARLSRYSPRSKMQRLPIENVSQASADQRAGRCGRVGPGVCIRLYGEDDYRGRERYTAPEILRSNLAAVILQLEALGLGQVEQFPFLDPPRPEAIRDGYKTLFELGAVDADHQLTPLGRTLHRLPVDPRIARLIVAGQHEGCLEEILVIASALEVQDPRERPLEKQQHADEAHRQFADPESDFVSALRLWQQYHKWKDDLTRSQLRKACQQNFLSYIRMKEWVDVHRELVELVRRQMSAERGVRSAERMNSNTSIPLSALRTPRWSLTEAPLEPARYAAIHRALLTGFLSSIAQRTESGEFLAAGGMKTSLWPGSSLADKSPKWVVCAELVETTRRFLRTVARIDPAWIEPLAEHLVTRTYTAPHWDSESLAVLAEEKVSLFGLPIVPKRRMRYARIDPVAARRMFLQHGLVAGEWPEPPEFLAHNLALAQQLSDLQTRSRQPAQLRDDDELSQFYQERLPEEICDGQRLLHWWRTEHARQPRLLHMTEADLLAPQAQLADPTLFPEQLQVRGLELPLTYKHEPGGLDDGVTVTVPQAGLNQLDAERLGWLIPGLLEEKVAALLRTLPKELRRELVPLPQTARQVAQALRFGEGSLTIAVSRALEAVCRATVPPSAFQEDRLPEFLRLRIEVVDEAGTALGIGRDLGQLREQLGAAATATFAATEDPRWTRDGITNWTFGDLPDSVAIERSGLPLTGYPTLLDRETSVSLRLLDSAVQAEHELRFGLRRLFCLASPRELKPHVDHLPYLNAWTLLSPTFPQPFPIRAQLTELVAERAFLGETPWPRTQGDFGLRVTTGRKNLSSAAADVVRQVQPLFEAYTQVRRLWERTAHPQFQATRQDVHDQLQHLLSPGFLVRTPWSWLVQFPRYLRAIARRLEKLTAGGSARDVQQLPSLLPRWQRCKERRVAFDQRRLYAPELETYRWMVEEYRVLLFAQELGTSVSVSEKRLDRQWALVPA
jgi:ATP-dependent helicase HrpA